MKSQAFYKRELSKRVLDFLEEYSKIKQKYIHLENLYFDKSRSLYAFLNSNYSSKKRKKLIKEITKAYTLPKIVQKFIELTKEDEKLNIIKLRKMYFENKNEIKKIMSKYEIKNLENKEIMKIIDDFFTVPPLKNSQYFGGLISSKDYGASYLFALLTDSVDSKKENEIINKKISKPKPSLEQIISEPSKFSKESLSRFKRFIKDPKLIDWREFEDLSEDYFRALGYNIMPVPVNEKGEKIRSGDGGMDVRFTYKTHFAEIKFGVQCKHYKNSLEIEKIDAFFGAMTRQAYNYGIFLISGEYTKGAFELLDEFITNNPSNKITLISGPEFQEMIKQLLKNDFNQVELIVENKQRKFKHPITEVIYRRTMLGINRILNTKTTYSETTFNWFLNYPKMLIDYATKDSRIIQNYKQEIKNMKNKYKEVKNFETAKMFKEQIEEIITDLETLITI